mgnify:CR=1 FL=1
MNNALRSLAVYAAAMGLLLAWAAVALLKRAVPESRAPRWLLLATRQIAATGPKHSSRMMAICGVTPVRMVGS